jgi:crotonobetainyl-CoA:carnitine CoA-transferase CaiB-like acyl-CoA transferase
MSRVNSFAAGLKVLDLSQYIPGPLAGLLLADMGADVLKIEPPGGDEMQNLGPRDGADRPVFYRALNAGKRCFRMNLKAEEVRAEFLELVADADILIEGFRPGVMARLGLDYATLSAINSRLIYCSISGYGARGPMAKSAGHDGNYLALAGVLHRNGDDHPVVYDPPVADMSGALFATVAILGAVNARHATGKGCEIDLALADAIMPLQLLQIADYGMNQTVPAPGRTYLNGGAAYYHVYPTADGRFVMLGSVEPKFWAAFCTAARRPDWIARQSEPIPQARLIADLTDFFEALPLGECLDRFAQADCCLSPVLDLAEALRLDRITGRRLVRPSSESGLEVVFPALIDGKAPQARASIQTAGSACQKPAWSESTPVVLAPSHPRTAAR